MITSNEDWTRVVLYGTYDGFVRKDESLQIAIMLDGGERVEIPSECVMSADQIIKKDKIKLKDVINRIKYFDLVTQAVWINGILNELGSGYGLHKYHEGYKQGKLDGAMEREKVQVPQFVADWIKYCKNTNLTMTRALIVDEVDFYNYANQKDESRLIDFLRVGKNQEIFARAWLDDYTIEKKWYLVKMKGLREYTSYLNYDSIDDKWDFADDENCPVVGTHHTREQLEKAGFGWVFDCPGVEVREVEE
nr:MAG TPA: Protein of unknown function (DUF1642) [Caudoviricetes sp.]